MGTETARDRRSERHAATKRDIVEAAWALSRQRGLAGWTLRDLASSVGMRAPSLYVYFDGKNALFDALFADGYAALLERVDATVLPAAAGAEPGTGGGARESLAAAARLFFDFGVEDPARYQLLFLRTIPGFTPSGDSYALAREVLDRTADVLAGLGLDAPEDLDLWTAVVSGLVAQQLSNDPDGDRWGRLVDRAVTGFLTGRHG